MFSRLILVCSVAVAFGCDDNGATGAGGSGGAGGDSLDGGGGAGGFVAPDTGPPRFDARVGPDGGRLARFREPCEDNLDCASRWCVPFEDRNVCSQTCLDEGCPDNWGCHAVANTEPDVVFICFPPGNRLCGVCLGDGDCPGGRCHLLDGQQVCGIDCDDDSVCPPGNTCEDVFGDGEGQCVPQTGSCTCDDSNDGEQRICEVSNPLGACFGRETCDPERGWVGCNAPTPAEEVCDQVDNDCNGFTDDIEGLGGVCEREVEIDGETIACSGRLVCTRETPDPVCTAPEPMGELCNFLDDDCDGETDEGFEERGEVCVVGTGQCQRVGVFECSPDGAVAGCNTEAGAAEDELCDSLDNDCDGEIDEDFDGLNDLCSVGVGACRRAGALRCTPEGDQALCTATPGEPADEVCDGIDNDCDGTADEGFEGLFEPCSVGVGACLRQGFLFCTADGAGVECTADAAEPAEESCNGVDDDCDGEADEAFDGLNEPCSSGVGLCNRAGVTACSEDGTEVECNAVPADVGVELCNGLDDDCDGFADETFPELDRVCEVGVGACARVGVLDCAPDGMGTVCAARAAEPAEDICDGLDNDCDGTTDEGFPLRDRPCTDGEGLCERNGIYRCTEAGDEVVCDAQAADAEDEVCDGLDNDCDGESDEAFPTLDELCSVGVGACLRSGIRVCTEDGVGVECNADAGEPAEELCDGVDNNCDGVTDEGYDDLLTPCNVGVGNCARGGVQVCAADGRGTICNVRPGDEGAEVCDSLDNDCDGTADEGFADLGTACFVGEGVCERAGVRRCSPDGDAVLCDAEIGPDGQEVCDRLDNDCDGETDEEFDGLGTACSDGVGICQRFGVRVCAGDGSAVVCNASAGDAEDELCDLVDNDCDGETDEGYDGLGAPCSDGLGVCQRFGVGVCAADGADVECDAEAGAAVAEVCDRLDNDCDGSTDEGYANLGTACIVGRGVCQRAGVRVCNGAGNGVTCNVDPGAGGAEVCDGLDNDCDGETDEGFAGLGTPCTAGQGICQAAGVRVCTGDGQGVVCDAEEGDPVAERCDNLDNDCDGDIDENYGQKGRACTVGQGICERVGVRVCRANGNGTECNRSPGDPEAEVCDRLDNDCDGSTDEAHPTLNQVCNVGNGLCRRSGVLVCNGGNPAGPVQCDADAGDPNPAGDVCDYQDDDCDNSVDEDFVDGAGRYVSLANCGACGTDCTGLWDPNPAAFGARPTCEVIGGVAQCSFNCLGGFLDADRVPNNGCELEIDPGAVYVATPEHGGVANNQCGAVQLPCSTIGRGLNRAGALGRPRVRVSDGVYREAFDLVEGIDVLGGHHNVTWIRDPALNVTIISGSMDFGGNKMTVRAIGIDEATVFDGFVVNGESPLQAGNAYGIYIRDCTSALTVSNNRVFAGNGGRGLDGDDGPNGAGGTNGGDGFTSHASGAPVCGGNPNNGDSGSIGAAGGGRLCGAVDVSGGRGGDTHCPGIEVQEGSGAIGGGVNGGSGGDGAWGFESDIASRCLVSDGGPADAFPGGDGNPGADGDGGNGAAGGLGLLSNDHWNGRSGQDGTFGTAGGGGGGGGGAAGVDVEWLPPAVDFGASGGGGGSGGCHGDQGVGAGAGGGSFGIFVTFSGAGPANAAAFPTLDNNTVARGLGGPGGAGGIGGRGGEGGLGGTGGPRGAGLFMGFCSFNGGEGGVGGRGGHGGGGGGGQGGVSYDIFVGNHNNRLPASYTDDNDFVIDAGDATHGDGGPGGASSNVATGVGGVGANGQSGNVAGLP